MHRLSVQLFGGALAYIKKKDVKKMNNIIYEKKHFIIHTKASFTFIMNDDGCVVLVKTC